LLFSIECKADSSKFRLRQPTFAPPSEIAALPSIGEKGILVLDSAPQLFGSFGANENGLLDMAGNVWEWTSTCFVRSVLNDAGETISNSPNCGVRVAEGQHRAYVTDFIRDARAGGCAVGVPPSNLGFRLVREQQSWIGSLSAGLDKMLSIAGS
jgi:Uncharacterized conserved protein